MKTEDSNTMSGGPISGNSSFVTKKGIALPSSLDTKLKLSPDMEAAITEVVQQTLKRALKPGGLVYRK